MTVRSGQGDYEVRPAAGPESIADLTRGLGDPFVAVDTRVAQLHSRILLDVDEKRIYKIPATEEEKTLSGVERLTMFLQAGGASKNSTLVVIGGGIVQDIGTFAAHIYYRGIPLHYVPTTLLSMGDSCIGAKCGVNLGRYKNQLGFFRSPAAVYVWPGFLGTLAADDIRSGLGEIVKLAVIDGPESFASLERRFERYGTGLDAIGEAIFASLETKRRVIEIDEYESGLRKTLNYGHTFGHALEAVTGHEVPHGLAVAWGMDVANYVAMRKGLLPKSDFGRIHALLARWFSLDVRHEYDAGAIIESMRRDKKAAGSSVTLILPKALGEMELVKTQIDGSLRDLVEAYVEEFDLFR
jgi:3-dehydroquinate synthase